MIDENRRKLIAALKSGDYKKGNFFLRRANNCFCVMGVAADLYDPTKWTQEGERHNYKYGNRSGVRPGNEVYEHYGLTHYNEVDYNAATFWMARNDGGMKFPEIAALMEKLWFGE